jgi:hypothetical protein
LLELDLRCVSLAGLLGPDDPTEDDAEAHPGDGKND